VSIFETWWKRRAPRWFRRQDDDVGDRWITAVGGMLDLARNGARLAARAGLVAKCPDDAVPYHGEQRRIEPLNASETVDAWRARLVDAWDHWDCGTTAALEALIGLYADCTATLYDSANAGWFTKIFDAGYGDANDDNWSRASLVLTDHSWVRVAIGPGLVVGPETVVGLSMTGTELRRIRRVWREKRPAHMVGADLVVVMDATTPADVLADHSYSTGPYDLWATALGPYKLIGYTHHGMTVGGITVGEIVE
jgi:hypothetical protein